MTTLRQSKATQKSTAFTLFPSGNVHYSLLFSALGLIWRMLQKICVVFIQYHGKKTLSNPLSCQNILTEGFLAHCFYTFDCSSLSSKILFTFYLFVNQPRAMRHTLNEYNLLSRPWKNKLDMYCIYLHLSICTVKQDRGWRSYRPLLVRSMYCSIMVNGEHILHIDTCGIYSSTKRHKKAKQSHKCVKNLYCVTSFDRLWHCSMFYVCKSKRGE